MASARARTIVLVVVDRAVARDARTWVMEGRRAWADMEDGRASCFGERDWLTRARTRSRRRGG